MNINRWKGDFESAILKKIDELEDKSLIILDIGIFPWNGTIELSALYGHDDELEDCFEDDVASWPYFDFSAYSEGLWPEVKTLCKDMNTHYIVDNSIKEIYFRSVAEVMKLNSVVSKLNAKKLSKNFEIRVLDSDSDVDYMSCCRG